MERAPENLVNQIQGKITTITGTPQVKPIEHKPRTESHNGEKKHPHKVEIQPNQKNKLKIKLNGLDPTGGETWSPEKDPPDRRRPPYRLRQL